VTTEGHHPAAVSTGSGPAADGPLTWRPLTRADIPAWVRLLAAVEAADRTGEHYDGADLTEEMADAGLDVTRDTIGLVRPDGELAGYGVVRAPRAVRDVDRIYLEGAIHPGHRRCGAGQRLLRWLEDRAAQAHQARFPQLPGEYEAGPFGHVAGTVALLDRAGYTPVRWWNVMRQDLPEPPAERRPVPAGLHLCPYDPARDDAVRRAHNEAFAGHWGSSERDPAEWAQWFTGQRAFQAASSFLAVDGEEIAGYVLSYFWAAEAAATGVPEGYIGQLGTRPAWRGRGVASALLGHTLRAFHAAGYRRASLDVDTDNASGALGLYQRHGFAVDTRRVTYVRPIR
jgi:mycothiol synthase